jgi:hypothetical protein
LNGKILGVFLELMGGEDKPNTKAFCELSTREKLTYEL